MYDNYINFSSKKEPLSFSNLLLIIAQKSGCNPKRSCNGYTARCSAHDDRNASLAVGFSDSGKLLLYCHAGCTVQKICASLGITIKELFPCKGKGY